MIKHLLVLLRRRSPTAGVRFKYVHGHAGVEGNEGADVSLVIRLILCSSQRINMHIQLREFTNASGGRLLMIWCLCC